MRSVYIHIPFCKSICSYCDFPKQIYNSMWASDYLDSLEEEIDKYYENDPIKSIYIGGGTPSVLSTEQLKHLFRILKIFNKDKEIEFSIECNPDDLTFDKIKLFKENGVNRISIGIESFDKKNLIFLNRNSNKKDIKEKINLIRSLGINNINVDLMYALPLEKLSTVKKDIKEMLKLDVEHISTYSLILEPHTKAYVEGTEYIDEELDAKMYESICDILKKKGYTHYEVSNFSKEGYESIHNLTYWDNEEYYGFGLGASGYLNDIRYTNTKNFQSYLEGEYRSDEIYLSRREDMENEIMLGLRKLKGIDLKRFYDKYGVNIQDEFNLESVYKDKLVILDGVYLRIPEDKIYVMNEIINRIIN